MSRPKAPSLASVELVDAEVIAGRGRRKTIHFVRVGDTWMAAAEHPAARVEQLEQAPGTVWHRRIELALPEGARLLRVVSEPLAEPRRNALEHLLSSRKGVRRRVRRIELRVNRRGRLENAEPEGKGRSGRSR